MVNHQGHLVTPAGQRVLDVNLRPMVLAPDAATTLNPDGTLLQNGQPVAQLRLARIDDLQQLTKAGHNAFTFHGPDTPPVADDTRLQVGALESSAANPITTLIQVTDATKAAHRQRQPHQVPRHPHGRCHQHPRPRRVTIVRSAEGTVKSRNCTVAARD